MRFTSKHIIVIAERHNAGSRRLTIRLRPRVFTYSLTLSRYLAKR